MKTHHTLHFEDSRNLGALADGSIHLVVTSPPYPMIEMWDETFSAMNPEIGEALESLDGRRAFRLMHEELAKVWRGLPRLLRPGSWVCINVGDATRTVGTSFRLFSNHSRIVETFFELGFDCLPIVIWRKQTNAPNKFMGSGMLPAGAYVTLEHEYVLMFRYGKKRTFDSGEGQRRRASAFFWEERNSWFSDLWDFKGARQPLNHTDTRERSGAFPFELAYRLVNMYSMQGDRVLDPFAGTGTTLLACAASARNSVGYEIDPKLAPVVDAGMQGLPEAANGLVSTRLQQHAASMADYRRHRGEARHTNRNYGFPVVTAQEVELVIPCLASVSSPRPGEYEVSYGAGQGIRPAEAGE